MNYRRILIAAVFILYIQWKKTVNNMTSWGHKLCQLQLSENKFPDAAYIFRMNSHAKFSPIRA